jgi:hypothetical protein
MRSRSNNRRNQQSLPNGLVVTAGFTLPESFVKPGCLSAGRLHLPLVCRHPRWPIGTEGPYFSVGAQGMYFTIPPGWTQEGLDPGFHYTPNNPAPYAVLDAPASYGFAPTQIGLGRIPTIKEPFAAGTTATQVAADVFTPQVTSAGGAVACTVDGDSAAFFASSYDRPSMGQRTGTWVLWLHQGLLYFLTIDGNGGTSTSAVHDAKEVLSSVTWSSASPLLPATSSLPDTPRVLLAQLHTQAPDAVGQRFELHLRAAGG